MQINRTRKYILNIYNTVYVLSTMLCLIWPSSQFSMAPDAPPRSVEDRRGAAAGLGRRRGPHACGLRESAPGRALGRLENMPLRPFSDLISSYFISFSSVFHRNSSNFYCFLMLSEPIRSRLGGRHRTSTCSCRRRAAAPRGSSCNGRRCRHLRAPRRKSFGSPWSSRP